MMMSQIQLVVVLTIYETVKKPKMPGKKFALRGVIYEVFCPFHLFDVVIPFL
jgi:hypothetical protein